MLEHRFEVLCRRCGSCAVSLRLSPGRIGRWLLENDLFRYPLGLRDPFVNALGRYAALVALGSAHCVDYLTGLTLLMSWMNMDEIGQVGVSEARRHDRRGEILDVWDIVVISGVEISRYLRTFIF